MKTISMDLDIYKSELEKEFERGRDDIIYWLSSPVCLYELLNNNWHGKSFKALKEAVINIKNSTEIKEKI